MSLTEKLTVSSSHQTTNWVVTWSLGNTWKTETRDAAKSFPGLTRHLDQMQEFILGHLTAIAIIRLNIRQILLPLPLSSPYFKSFVHLMHLRGSIKHCSPGLAASRLPCPSFLSLHRSWPSLSLALLFPVMPSLSSPHLISSCPLSLSPDIASATE